VKTTVGDDSIFDGIIPGMTVMSRLTGRSSLPIFHHGQTFVRSPAGCRRRERRSVPATSISTPTWRSTLLTRHGPSYEKIPRDRRQIG